MKKLTFFVILCTICFTQSSFTSLLSPEISIVQKKMNSSELPWVVYVPISNTFSLGGSDFTVTQTIAYVFNDNFILQEVYVSQNWMISVDCGGSSNNYTRPTTDMSFDVSNNEITNVHFATTGIRELDDLYGNSTFKSQYLSLVRDNVPK